MKNRRIRRLRLVGGLVLMLLFTAGVSWFFGYQSRNSEEISLWKGEDDSVNNRMESDLTIPMVSPDSMIYDSVETKETSTTIIPQTKQEDGSSPSIRILIHTSDYQSLWHEEIQITSDEAFLVSWSGGEQLYPAGEVFVIQTDDSRLQKGNLGIQGKGGFTLPNIQRACGTPSYPGRWEIRLWQGKMALINEVDLEEYLNLVVPGEMPASYGVEALKVQAVCARSYAWCSLENPGYEFLGAHVDDSVNDQVYNNQASSDLAVQAVKETCGQVLQYGGKVVETYYYSTSCGHTTDMEIWQADPAAYPYYPAAAVAEGREVLDLTKEDTFRSFLQWYRQGFDAGCDFYRWRIRQTLEELSDSLDVYLKEQGMASIGEVQDLQVISRGNGGIVRELSVTGSEGKVVLERQGNIREALGHAKMVIELEDEQQIKGWEMLPSAFFYLEEILEGENLIGYVFHGGGYGHGVGMSQSGVGCMCEAGYAYDEILEFFYPRTDLMEIF